MQKRVPAKKPAKPAKGAKGAKGAKPAKAKPAPTASGPSGADEAAAWLAARGIATGGKTRWNVNIALDVVDAPATAAYAGDTATRFHLDIYRDEWGFVFVHRGKTSHIRRTDRAFVSGTDGHALLARMPPLADVA